MIIMHILYSLFGAYYVYAGIDMMLTEWHNIWCALLGGAYALAGILLIAYMGADACDHYGWRR